MESIEQLLRNFPSPEEETIPVFTGLDVIIPCFVPALRTTVCDIMCTTNTAYLEHDAPSLPPGEMPVTVNWPYEKATHGIPTDMKTTTRFQKFKYEETKSRKTAELRRDREAFMFKLYADKHAKQQRLHRAAVLIQSTFRGFKARPKPLNFVPKRKRMKLLNQNELYDELCEMAYKLNLKPIAGLNLESRQKASKRKVRIDNAAAFRIQRFMRMIFMRKKAMIVVAEKRVDRVNRAARVITKSIRFIKTKNFVKRIDSIKKEKCAKKIQSQFRRYLAAQRVKQIRKGRVSHWAKNEAAIIIQRNFSSKNRGALRMARATMLSIRSVRRMLDITLDSVKEVIVQELIKLEVDEYVQNFSAVFFPTIAKVEKMIIQEVSEAAWADGLEEWIMEQLRLLELERQRVAAERQRMEEVLLMSAAEDEMVAILAEEQALRDDVVKRQSERVDNFVEAATEQVIVILFESMLEDSVAHHAVEFRREEELQDMEQSLHIAELRRMACADVAEKFAEDTLTTGLKEVISSIIAEEYRRQAIEALALLVAEEAASDMAASVCSDAYSHFAQDMLEINVPTVDNSCVLASIVDEDESNMSGVSEDSMTDSSGTDLPDAPEQSRVMVHEIVKDSAELFAQARYDETLEQIEPQLRDLEEMLANIPDDDEHRVKIQKATMLISVTSLLKGRCLLSLARYDESKVLFEKVQADRESVLGPHHYLTAEVLFYISQWHRSLGYHDPAEHYLRDADDILIEEMRVAQLSSSRSARSATSGDNTSLSKKSAENTLKAIPMTLFKLFHRVKIARCELLRNLGQYFKIQELLREVRTSTTHFQKFDMTSAEVQEEFRLEFIHTLVVVGKFDDAIKLHEELLDSRKEYYGDNHPKVATSLDMLGRLLLHKADSSAGAKMIEDAMNIRYSRFPQNHPAIASSHVSKAEVLLAQGLYEEAYAEGSQALALFRQSFGQYNEYHPAIARTLMVLSNVHTQLGEPFFGTQAAQDSYQIFLSSFKSDIHQKLVESIAAVGESLLYRRNFAQAKDVLQTAIQRREIVLRANNIAPAEHHLIADLLQLKLQYHYCSAMSGPATNVILDMKTCLDDITNIVGKKHPIVARHILLLAEVCKVKGNHADAKSYVGTAYDLLAETHGEDHGPLPLVLSECADNLRIPGYFTEAMELNEVAVTNMQRFLQNNLNNQQPAGSEVQPNNKLLDPTQQNTHFAQILSVKALLCQDINHLAEAEEIFMQVVAIALAKAGDESGYYSVAMGRLAHVYCMQGRFEESERTFQISLPICRSTCGEVSFPFVEMLLHYSVLLMDVRHWQLAYEILTTQVLPALEAMFIPEHMMVLFARANASTCQQMDEFISQSQEVMSISEESLLSQALEHEDVRKFLSSWHSAGFAEDHPWVKRFSVRVMLHLKHHRDCADGSSVASGYDNDSMSYYTTGTSQQGGYTADFATTPRSLVEGNALDGASLESSLGAGGVEDEVTKPQQQPLPQVVNIIKPTPHYLFPPQQQLLQQSLQVAQPQAPAIEATMSGSQAEESIYQGHALSKISEREHESSLKSLSRSLVSLSPSQTTATSIDGVPADSLQSQQHMQSSYQMPSSYETSYQESQSQQPSNLLSLPLGSSSQQLMGSSSSLLHNLLSEQSGASAMHYEGGRRAPSSQVSYTPRSLVSGSSSKYYQDASRVENGTRESPRSVYTGRSGYSGYTGSHLTPSTVRSRLRNVDGSSVASYQRSLDEGGSIAYDESRGGNDNSYTNDYHNEDSLLDEHSVGGSVVSDSKSLR